MAYKRSIYLINPRFQLRFSVYVCLLIILSSIIYPFILIDLTDSFILMFEEMYPGQASNIAQQRSSLLLILFGWQLLWTLLSFIICIFLSHKVAGPLFKLQKFLAGIRDGNPYGKLYFRKGDYFQEIADDYNDTFEQIQETYKNDFVYLSEVSTYINNLIHVVPEDKKVVLNEINRKLAEIQSRFNNAE